MKNIPISIFFPAYNEEENIASTISAAQKAAEKITNDYEIIVVNDGSSDKTGAIADALARKDTHIKVVHHNPNQGYGAAVWSGIQAATKEYVFFTDADLQFDLQELGNLTKYADDYDVVIGYRAHRRDPFMRILNAKGWNWLNRTLFKLRVKDIDCAFKLFKRDLVKDLPVASRGAMLSAEMLIRLQRRGITFKEVPVTHLPRIAGSPTGAKLAVIIRAFKELFNVYKGDLGDARMITLARFILLGALNTVLDWTWYFTLTRSVDYFADHLILAKAIAFLIGSVPIFITGAYWVFPEKEEVTVATMAKLYSILAIAFFINTGVLLALIDHRVPDLAAIVVATAASFAWNLSVFWIFLVKNRIAFWKPEQA